MPEFMVTGPDGSKYKVTGPEGATEQQAIEFAKGGQAPKIQTGIWPPPGQTEDLPAFAPKGPGHALPWETPKEGQEKESWFDFFTRLPRGIYQSAKSGVTLPGDVAAGRVPMRDDSGRSSPELISRATDLAGLVTLGGGGPKGTIGAGIEKPGTPKIEGAGVKLSSDARPPLPSEALMPKSFMDRIWDNYAKRVTPDEMLASEPVWGGAKNLAAEKGIPESDAFSIIANDMFSRMNANRFMTPETARRYMGEERGVGAVKSPTLGAGMGLIPKAAGAIKPYAQALQTGVRKIFNPQLVSPVAGEAEASLRSRYGSAARDTEVAKAALEPFRREINSRPEPARIAFIDDLERGRPAITPELRALSDELRSALDKRMNKLMSLPKTAQMDFVNDYYPHMWQDRNAATTFAQNWNAGTGKLGSGASTKKRSVPFVSDGLASGLKLVSTDPIETVMRYVTSMDNFIARHEVLDEAERNGHLFYGRPKTMGASGHPGMGHNLPPIPPGYVELKGIRDNLGNQAYAPEDWARVFNRYVGRPLWDEAIGDVVDAVQKASNWTTALELGLSGFHTFNIATSGVATAVGQAVANIAGGRPKASLTALGNVIAPVREAIPALSKGKKFEQAYLDRTAGTPRMRELVDLLTEGGGRAIGKAHAADYSFTNAGSFVTAWKRGALRLQAREAAARVKGSAFPVGRGAVELGSAVGRIMETISDPLFKQYIPRMKNAAFYDTMGDWLDANSLATHSEKTAMARKIIDSIDNRYGEMIQDNILWSKGFKQIAQISMLSYSWTLGLFRQLKGAAQAPKDISIKGQFNPDLAATIGSAIAIPMILMVYQYLKTGKTPESIDDVMAPQTGGTGYGAFVPSLKFGKRGSQARVPERAMLPSHERDIFGWYYEPRHEATNKLSPFLRFGAHMALGEDWARNPLLDFQDYLKEVEQSLPISIRQATQGQLKGSALGVPAALLGIRPAPPYLQDPKGYELAEQNRKILARRKRAVQEKRQQSRMQGPLE